MQLQEEAEKRRVLEDALHIMAKEHYVLEQSVISHRDRQMTGVSDCDNDTADDMFFDAPESLTHSVCEVDLEYKDVTDENIALQTDDEYSPSVTEETTDVQTSDESDTPTPTTSGQEEATPTATPTMRKKVQKYRKKLPNKVN